MNINWYPGHMKKTRELIANNIKLVDCVVELIDARLPFSSHNPAFDDLIADKPRVLAMTKVDLADPVKTEEWIKYYQNFGMSVVKVNANQGQGISDLIAAVQASSIERSDKIKRQKRINHALRMMIIGVPNVGKSSLINKLVGKNVAKTGNKAGVTKGKQWVRLDKDLELFDTPGILWPKIESDEVGLRLAYSGAIKDEILPTEDIALYFLRDILPLYPAEFSARYGIEFDLKHFDALQAMEEIAVKRGCILGRGQIDYQRIATLLLGEFRKGKIGRLSLELPSDYQK